ncbi:MAG: 23S rRNA (cytidine(2498)-2'-O)-methyltransferase RlmM [Candidatus Methylumidiphilus sp.]
MTSATPTPNALLLHCRPGFEKECAAEIQAQAQKLEVLGYAKAKPDSGFVLFTPYDETGMATLRKDLPFVGLCFARQMVAVLPLISGLPVNDRITPLLAAAAALSRQFSDVFFETADTNEAKELAGFVRKFNALFRQAMVDAGLASEKPSAARLHLFFINSTTAYVGVAKPGNSSPWPMGIPRLKFPRAAPSRSTLKLEEAFLFFLGDNPKALQPGMRAVDLGAAPGGWTWQMAKRSIRVAAVDNGPMDQALLDSGIVEHIRADGFRYLPAKPVEWLVCDMVEQPSRIAALVGRWLAEGHCRQAIFNLKLPMKKRYEELTRCRDLIETALDTAEVPFRLAFKQLYHDREEVTGYLQRL